MWKAILVMALLLIIGPFELQIRISYDFYPNISLSRLVFYSWLWVYSFVGYGTNGFITRPFYQIAQPGSLQTFFPVIFLLTLILFQLGAVSKKEAIRVGYASFIPGLFTLAMNLILSIFVPFGSTIIAPIPTPLASILGILMLKRLGSKQDSRLWPSED